jgi:preprotein translocase subunit SecF
MTDWLKRQWVKLAAGCATLLLFVAVYFAGRWKRNGELDFAAAKRELELNTARGATLQKQLDANHTRQAEIVGDILSEEIALSQQKEANHALSPDEVLARLRAHGLVR